MMTTSTDTFINKHIGRYEIRERIGSGGMARVFKAWDTNLERPVAIKILHDHLTEDPNFKERFEREAKLVAGLNHPNIVQIYDYDFIDFNSQMLSYMVMPFIPGKTLKEVLEETAARGERIEYKQILSVMLNLTSALSYAHARGMVHRDVKPANIMFNEHGQAILTDFGIARLSEGAQLTQEGATIGTPTYFAPEQAVGKPVDARSDLYALGIILYEMLAGTPPYNDENSVSIILKHLNAPIPSVSERMSMNDVELDHFIFKALAKEPKDRFQTAEEFAAHLTPLLSKSGTSAARPIQTAPRDIGSVTQPIPTSTSTASGLTTLPPTTTSTQAIPQRSPLNILAFVVAVLALLIALALVFAQRSQPIPTSNPDNENHISSMTSNRDVYFLSTFSADDTNNSNWPVTTEGSILRQVSPDGFYQLQNQLRNTAATSIYNNDFIYQDGTITIEATLDENSPPDSDYGIVFRYMDDLNYNVFAVDGQGRFGIWSLASGVWHELRDAEKQWSKSDFVNPIGQKNQITVTFVGDHLIGSVNQENYSHICWRSSDWLSQSGNGCRCHCKCGYCPRRSHRPVSGNNRNGRGSYTD